MGQQVQTWAVELMGRLDFFENLRTVASSISTWVARQETGIG